MRFNRDRLAAFAERALSVNVSYFAVRRELFGLLSAALDAGGDLVVPNQEFITLRTFLSSRSNQISDDARLAFEVALLHIIELVGA